MVLSSVLDAKIAIREAFGSEKPSYLVPLLAFRIRIKCLSILHFNKNLILVNFYLVALQNFANFFFARKECGASALALHQDRFEIALHDVTANRNLFKVISFSERLDHFVPTLRKYDLALSRRKGQAIRKPNSESPMASHFTYLPCFVATDPTPLAHTLAVSRPVRNPLAPNSPNSAS